MKISKLTIESHRQFENIQFDFRYPTGHTKAGKPLDKICLIGQSATGKTSILELIRKVISSIQEVDVFQNEYLLSYNLGFKGSLECEHANDNFFLQEESVILNDKEYKTFKEHRGGWVDSLLNYKLRLLYLSADIISNEAISFLSKNPLDILDDWNKEKSYKTNLLLKDGYYDYNLNSQLIEDLWIPLLYNISLYRKRFAQMASEVIQAGVLSDMKKHFETWSLENKNPLEEFKNFFNPILQRLGLEIDSNNTESLLPIKSIKNSNIIPIPALSTGTKGLLLSLFPLSEINTTDAIIFIDEPERSLFPDIQIDLISYYQKLAPEAQLIVATHSPFIAASFEPEERFILYFDEQGKVALRKGESPIGDDPNDLLRNDFKVDYYNKFGKDAYQQYLNLKTQAANTTDKEKKKQLIGEAAALGDKYNF
jgi:hypothetical protein